MSEAEALFAAPWQSVDAPAEALQFLIERGSERQLYRINMLAFAAKSGVNEERAPAAFLHAVRNAAPGRPRRLLRS